LGGLGAEVYSGGARGLFTIHEVIIMIGSKERIWTAAIDPDKNIVKYFTNDPAYFQKLPKNIKDWRERFKEKKVVFNK
jgi:hypothetical protein